MSKKGIETLVGLFVLLGLAGLVFLSLKAANLASFGTRDSYSVKAHFDNIGGLKARSPVRSAGVNVGRVTSISLDPKDFRGLVVMELDKSVQFPKDSSAKILTSGLLGEQYVSLDPGGDTVFLKEGERLAKTQSAVVLEKLLSQFLFNKAAEGGDKK